MQHEPWPQSRDSEEEEQDEHLERSPAPRRHRQRYRPLQAVNPAVLINAHGGEQLLQQHRDTRNPNTEVSRIRLRSGQGLFKGCEVNVLGGNLTGVLVLELGVADSDAAAGSASMAAAASAIAVSSGSSASSCSVRAEVSMPASSAASSHASRRVIWSSYSAVASS